jgi:Fe-S oxidoreductase
MCRCSAASIFTLGDAPLAGAAGDGVRTLSALTPAQRERSVVLVQDAFTRYFEAPLLADLVELISRLGYQVYLAPFSANGKPLHVQGFLCGVQPRGVAQRSGNCVSWRRSACRWWVWTRR